MTKDKLQLPSPISGDRYDEVDIEALAQYYLNTDLGNDETEWGEVEIVEDGQVINRSTVPETSIDENLKKAIELLNESEDKSEKIQKALSLLEDVRKGDSFLESPLTVWKDISNIGLKTVTIRVPEQDLSRLKQLGKRLGVGYTTAARMILHDSLEHK